MKDSEDNLLNKIKELSEKLDDKRTGLSNIQWTNDLAVLKTCLDDVEAIQADIEVLKVRNHNNHGNHWEVCSHTVTMVTPLQADKDELKSKQDNLTPSDPLYGKFDAVMARCIEKFDDTKKQADRSHHDLSVLKKFLEGRESWVCVTMVTDGSVRLVLVCLCGSSEQSQ